MDLITVNTLMKYTVVTTFNADGYNTYGRRMIETFLKNWPKNITLVVYAEDCTVSETADNLIVRDLNEVTEMVTFKNKWRNVPKANGDVSNDPIRSKRKDAGKGFKWDAVRFAHKVYSIFDCARRTDSDWLLWMDADMVCHSPITLDKIISLCSRDLCFLGRRGKYTECGLYAMNLRSVATIAFLQEFQRYYDDAENGIFTLDEWHDSFVFDAVRLHSSCRETDWSSHLISGEGHPLINSEWGAYLDHLKGKRKDYGKSTKSDLIVNRHEKYWINSPG
jgi:hypothetical protein